MRSLGKDSRPASQPDVVSHVRYALGMGKKPTEFVGHSGGCQGTPIVQFDNARIWARKQDAVNYLKHPNVSDVRKKLELVEVFCVVGTPFAVMME